MSKIVDFKTNISLLVGINGSGKTSVFNVINWLLNVSIADLCMTQFEEISVTVKSREVVYTVKANQTGDLMQLELADDIGSNQYHPITVRLSPLPKNIHMFDIEELDQIRLKYSKMTPEPSEEITWKKLTTAIPTPTLIGIDRQLYAETGRRVKYQVRRSTINDRDFSYDSSRTKSPLANVEETLNGEYNTYRNKLLILNRTLNEKVIMSAFDPFFMDPNNISNIDLNTKTPNVDDIDKLKEQVIEFLNDTAIDPKNEIIVDYFTGLKRILNEGINNKKDNFSYLININQFQKINVLVQEFAEFYKQKKKLYNPLKVFIETVNKFFLDSAKQLAFDTKTSKVKLNLLNSDGKQIGDVTSLRELSSGEQQILTLLSFVKYRNRKSILIIDEPELSLHPRWQSDFLSTVELLMPKGSQVLIATHSPEIVGDRRDYCTVLLPYNTKS